MNNDIIVPGIFYYQINALTDTAVGADAVKGYLNALLVKQRSRNRLGIVGGISVAAGAGCAKQGGSNGRK